MTISRWQIEVPSRLHFGLLSFGQGAGSRYGGVGLMVESPGARLVIEPADRLVVSGPHAARLREFALRWQRFCGKGLLAHCHLRLLRAAPQHVGLGTGTQLGLAVAASLFQLHQLPLPDAPTLAASVGRGARSGVGTHGFLQGGLIFDRGKSAGESLGELGERVELPAAWRVVQICPARRAGLCGTAELNAFARLPAVPESVTQRLLRIVHQQLLPSARTGDLPSFGEAVYGYGLQAGSCFVEQQGGPFASPLLASWVQTLRQHGVRGVGQSSWGPTLFALTEDASSADGLASWVREHLRDEGRAPEVRISPVANRGARWTESSVTSACTSRPPSGTTGGSSTE